MNSANVGALLKEALKLVLNICADCLVVNVHMEDMFIPNFQKFTKVYPEPNEQ